MIKKCLLFLLLLLAVGSVNAIEISDYSNQTDVDMGGWTAHAFVVIDEPGEYVVTADFVNNSLDSNSIVFLINNTENVTLDCNEMSFTTNTTNSSILVYSYNSSNIVVKNLNANWSKDTIIFENVNDSTIENSEIITSGYSIKLVDSYGATISGNDITVANGEYYGIYVDGNLENGTIFGNTINVTNNNNVCGIYTVSNITNSVISGNTITVNSTSYGACGIYADYTIENNTISGNTITAYAYNEVSGICAYYGNILNTTMEDNVLDFTSDDQEVYSIYANYNITNSVISGNDITACARYWAWGIGAYWGEILNTTIENNAFNTASDEAYAEGIYAYLDIKNSVISGNTLTAYAYDEASGIWNDGNIIGSTIENNVFDLYAYNYDEYGTASGIYVCYNLTHSIISGNDITAESNYSNACGIVIDEENILNTIISGNTFISESNNSNAYGICVEGYNIENSTISGNTITAESNESDACGIYVDDDTINSTISGNTITLDAYCYAYGIYFYYDAINTTVEYNVIDVYAYDDYAYGIYAYYDLENSIISGNTITADSYDDYAYGIYVDDYFEYSTISGNTIKATSEEDDAYGIYCEEDAINSTIENNVITATSEDDEAYGIYSCYGEYSTYSGNTINATSVNYSAYGFYIDDIYNITFSENIVEASSENDEAYALYLYGTTTSAIFENTFTSANYSIYIDSSDENRFYLNNIDGLLNNGTDNYFVSSETITYSYNGKSYTSILGNYWVGYDESDTNGDGIIDTPYTLNGTNDTKPLTDVWNDGEIGNYVAPSRSSGGSGRSYDSDISDEIESKVIKNFVSSATVLFGNGIDEQYAVQLRERVTDANGYTISGNAVIVGGPLANPFAREYNEQFEMPISNDNPGENRGIIQFMTIQDNSGTIIRSYTIVYIAGSDRLGTQAALEYFKTLDELPEGPLMVEWTADGPVVVE
ncbi:nitrous oxidase accessory protein NosD [Methanococcus maripaludis]|uniref:Nitrous oxidase accessory protein NosD n=1 Tax=Methanococcus maripaludis TaxID=39152 RepID=A0A7J9NYI2_METMI|nr:NosD domain-containing protein [Methanococcus maripaludis]MBA2852758.1 nitrous oxidase accessory protein NosD [Methanococcus maripaludis]